MPTRASRMPWRWRHKACESLSAEFMNPSGQLCWGEFRAGMNKKGLYGRDTSAVRIRTEIETSRRKLRDDFAHQDFTFQRESVKWRFQVLTS